LSIDQRGTLGSCPSDETIAAFVDGVLSDAERADVERHVATCDRCFELLAELGCQLTELDAEAEPAPSSLAASPAVIRPIVTPKPRAHVWRWGMGLAAAASLAVVAVWLARAPDVTITADGELADGGARRTLIEQVGSHRTSEARLTGFSWGAVPSVLRSGSEVSRRPPEILAAAGLALQETDRKETAGAHRVAGLAYLLLGDYERAIERLEEARRSTPTPPASLLSDLGAAYLERGRLQGRTADLTKGAELAEQAVVRPDALPAAWFNRALALEQLGLRDRAIAAWKDYLARAAPAAPGAAAAPGGPAGQGGPAAPGASPAAEESRWIDEARQRLRDLGPPEPATPPPTS
jgi:hypothetical protein